MELYYGKGLISRSLYKEIGEKCDWPTSTPSKHCEQLLDDASRAVGPHNVYDIYDNCPQTADYLKRLGNKTMRWLLKHIRNRFNQDIDLRAEQPDLLGGGYEWSCGDTYPPGAVSPWFANVTVQKALNLDAPGQSRFQYKTSGPASFLLYPNLIRKIRVLIYNGDADACVPYIGNAEWLGELEKKGIITEDVPWRPWFEAGVKGMPAGYVTTYNVSKSEVEAKLTFLTIRLAGHMVPLFQPGPALTFVQRFLSGDKQ